MELPACQLRDVAGVWFEMWEKERDEDNCLPTWEEFEEAFISNFIPEEDMEAKGTEFEQLKQGNKSVQEYYMELISLAKHASHMVKTEKAKICSYSGRNDSFFLCCEFRQTLRKRHITKERKKEHSKKAQTAGGFSGKSSGGGRGSFNKESLAPTQSSHQSGGGSSFRCLCGTCKRQHSGQCKLEFYSCYHCGESGHIKANCPKLRRNFNGGSTCPSSSSPTIVAPPQAHGSHNQVGHGAGRGADRVT
uniref:Uncharacterized protein LOC104243671 n=1 Tax=Nicotiana sylvestris TaxID=4096 RepID=A0A1U7YD75_NICSY|nr:PREDICTED: uncharacterized protein LOC104243671 [Nicotiana sylvestris]